MNASEIAAILNITERMAQMKIQKWRESGVFRVRLERGGRGRPRYVVDADHVQISAVVTGLQMAA